MEPLTTPEEPKQMESKSEPSRNPKERGVVGLMNMRNTCYANSTIQIIRAVPELSAMIVSEDLKDKIVNKESNASKILLAYQDLIRALWSAYRPAYVRPMGFLSEIRTCVKDTVYESFGMPIQNDSHEYLVYLLDNFHEAMNKNKDKKILDEDVAPSASKPMSVLAKDGWERFMKQNDSPIVELCFGMMRQTIECMECKNKSYQWPTFNVFKIACEGDTMHEWIANELKSEELDDYDCIHCRPTRRKAQISRHIWQLPSVMFTSIRRFTPDMRKIMKPCPYDGKPIRFDEHFAKESTHASRHWIYQLRGVVDHIGSHMGGHYSSQFCHPMTQDWWWFDDESIAPLPSPRIQLGSNYVFLFRAVPFSDMKAQEA